MTEAKNALLFDLAGKRVYVAGHTGMVGAARVRRLRSESCTILTIDRALDLTRQARPRDRLSQECPSEMHRRGLMTQEEADHQIAVMRGIYQDYKEQKRLEDECDFGEGR
jgi:nucleoside-diphosphate-sugar epimerase